MLPESISPRAIRVLVLYVSWSFLLFVMPLEFILVGRFHFRAESFPHPGFFWMPLLVLFNILAPMVLRAVGIRVRGRSVERSRADDRDEGAAIASDLPIHIREGRRMIEPGLLVAGSGFLIGQIAPAPLGGMIGTALVCFGLALTRFPWRVYCMITRRGIRAPEGLFGWPAFVPWDDIDACEIVRDDLYAPCDHFVLRDRSGGRHFRRSARWLVRLTPDDRARVLRAVQARFPLEAKGDPIPATATATPLWDRELDG